MVNVPTDLSKAESFNGIPNNKAGTVRTCTAHIFCAVVGSGILNLPQCVAWLGSIAGTLALIVCYLISLVAARMLAECYYWNGVEHGRYHHAVRNILGRRDAIITSCVQLLHISLITIAYTITGASAIVSIAQLACQYEGKDLDSASCFSGKTGGTWKATLMFGAVELVLSQTKNLHELAWMSVAGTVGSLAYGFIALGLSLSEVSNQLGDIGGIPVGFIMPSTGEAVSTADKVFNILSSFGSIAFAFSFSLILLEIQDTLHQPPAAKKSMKKAINLAITGSFLLYILVATTGYAAIGNGVAGIVLDSFTGPKWLLIIAFVAILAHMLTAFQLFAQALFNSIESHVKWRLLEKAVEKEQSNLITASVAEQDGDANAMPTPFDAAATAKSQDMKKAHLLAGKSKYGFDQIKFQPLEERLSNVLSGNLGNRELSEFLATVGSLDCAISASLTASLAAPGAEKDHLYRNSTAMFSGDIGFANEEVPMNEEGFLVPIQYRLLLRTAVVLAATFFAALLPFFSAFISVVGSITFYPLTIYMPINCYRTIKGDRLSKSTQTALTIILWAMAFVCAASAIASVRGVIKGIQTYSIFGLS